ncbi:hypothetical protein AMECASPLE_030872 [Ameca splendens]|uniref:Uncharacterized protein n=1 Tax=Ameca splendens TaxID=208324 RepID=A0ABV0Y6E1_9TELE
MNLLTTTLAAPLVHAIRTALQQCTVTHLLVHLLTSPPGSKNKEIITNKHHSTPPLSLCGYTHLPPLELHNLIRSKLIILSIISVIPEPNPTSSYNLPPIIIALLHFLEESFIHLSQ